ncbi:hypothetical protein [Sediminibacterium sp.]|uniref:hypothetical protein n=1 Tax=Sediminibacterium sp. TaxID=1917865 RepID=UPI003F714B17
MNKEKRKWQIAFRRYVLEDAPSEAYAPYFGIDRAGLRNWIEIQFTNGLTWENHALLWQFDHVVPIAFFDFSKEEELKLCWNFINLRVEPTHSDNSKEHGTAILGAKKYFTDLYLNAGFGLAKNMIEKIEGLEANGLKPNKTMLQFLTSNKDWLLHVNELTKEEFHRYNTGTPIEDLLLEREILKKFG